MTTAIALTTSPIAPQSCRVMDILPASFAQAYALGLVCLYEPLVRCSFVVDGTDPSPALSDEIHVQDSRRLGGRVCRSQPGDRQRLRALGVVGSNLPALGRRLALLERYRRLLGA